MNSCLREVSFARSKLGIVIAAERNIEHKRSKSDTINFIILCRLFFSVFNFRNMRHAKQPD